MASKMKATLVIVALISAMVMLGVPSALASHTDHHARPYPVRPGPNSTVYAECVVNGTVTLDPGVSLVPSHGHYTFVSTTLECVETTLVASGWGGTYDPVRVNNGPTDGPDHAAPYPFTGHGEDCVSGWSWAPANLTGTHDHAGANAINGEVEFNRHGSVVEAWGTVTATGAHSHAPDTVKFHAELQFTPTDGDCVEEPVVEAQITGEATLYFP